MKRSDCCGADKYGDYDICLECKEHADFWDDEEQDSNLDNPDYNLNNIFGNPIEELSNIINEVNKKRRKNAR